MSRLAVLCDPDGCITRVLLDDDALLTSDAVGGPLSWLLTDHSIGAFYELMAALVQQPVICDWTLDLVRPGGSRAYCLSAARVDDEILLVGGRTPFAGDEWPELLASADSRIAGTTARLVERAGDQRARIADLKRQVDALRAQTRSSDKLENALVRVAAHDLRNPILALRMNGSFLLQHNDSLDAGARAVVGEMLGTCDFMERFLDGMTSLSRVWVGALELDRERVDGRHWLTEVTREVSDIAAARDIAIDLVRADRVTLDVDVRKVTRVLHEVLNNAITFCGSGALIEVQLIATERGACVQIDDDGPGIAASMRQTLFRPFGKSPSDSPRGYGAGVGLPIARRIVEAHGGGLRVESRDGAGTRVIVDLPVCADANLDDEGRDDPMTTR